MTAAVNLLSTWQDAHLKMSAEEPSSLKASTKTWRRSTNSGHAPPRSCFEAPWPSNDIPSWAHSKTPFKDNHFLRPVQHEEANKNDHAYFCCKEMLNRIALSYSYCISVCKHNQDTWSKVFYTNSSGLNRDFILHAILPSTPSLVCT